MTAASAGSKRVSIVGLGKLGSPMAAVFAARGFEVIGVDLHLPYVEAVNAGRAPVDEPQLQDYITAGRSRLRATSSYAEAVAGSDVSFVIVPTPSDADHFFSNEFVVDAVRGLGRAL